MQLQLFLLSFGFRYFSFVTTTERLLRLRVMYAGFRLDAGRDFKIYIAL